MSGIPYLQPGSMEELRALLSTLPEKTAVLAGGTDLMPKMRSQKLGHECILSLWRVPELQVIEEQEGWLKIGAVVTHAAAAANELIRRYFNGLYMACSHVGSQQIRNKGTLGGSMMNASPAGDIAPCIFLYGGELEVLGKDGFRRIGVEQFLSSSGKPAVQPGELLTAIWLPIRPQLHSCFIKLGSRREVTIAQISMCAAWEEGCGIRVCSAYTGAIDRRPVPLPDFTLLQQAETADQAAESVAAQIQEIRCKRNRPPKLKLTQAEQLYKERAVKGVVYDLMEAMGVLK